MFVLLHHFSGTAVELVDRHLHYSVVAGVFSHGLALEGTLAHPRLPYERLAGHHCHFLGSGVWLWSDGGARLLRRLGSPFRWPPLLGQSTHDARDLRLLLHGGGRRLPLFAGGCRTH